MARASLLSLILSRHMPESRASEDPFYADQDFSWDIFRTLFTKQEALYQDPNYVRLLGGFAQNLLYPTGSRAVKRAVDSGASENFAPRQIRAIPHNAILQQFGTLANIFYGFGAASQIDPDKFIELLKTSSRARSLLVMIDKAGKHSPTSILAAYARLFDPGFWIVRAVQGEERRIEKNCLDIAQLLRSNDKSWPLLELTNRLNMDWFTAKQMLQYFTQDQEAPKGFAEEEKSVAQLHALRLAVFMKIFMLASQLPAEGDQAVSRMDVIQRLLHFQIDSVVEDLKKLSGTRQQFGLGKTVARTGWRRRIGLRRLSASGRNDYSSFGACRCPDPADQRRNHA